jgi:hypothetical protein
VEKIPPGRYPTSSDRVEFTKDGAAMDDAGDRSIVSRFRAADPPGDRDTAKLGPARMNATSNVATTPKAPAEGAFEGTRIALAQAGLRGKEATSPIQGTTFATNALIERRGAPEAIIPTTGFRDILEMAYERCYSQYDINLE